jgi:hypothetical protein
MNQNLEPHADQPVPESNPGQAAYQDLAAEVPQSPEAEAEAYQSPEEVIEENTKIFGRLATRLNEARDKTAYALVSAGVSAAAGMGTLSVNEAPGWLKLFSVVEAGGAAVWAWKASRKIGDAETVARYGAGEEVDLPKSDRDLDPTLDNNDSQESKVQA